MVFATIQPVSSISSALTCQNLQSQPASDPARSSGKYFCVATLEEVEETIRKHTEDTYSHFVVAKKTKSYGSSGKLITLFEVY